MKKNLKKLLTLASVATLMVASTLVSHADWKKDNVGWWYQNSDGTYPTNAWVWIDGNKDGVSECYYFDKVGYCLLNTTTPDGYTVDANGAWTVNGVVQTKVASSNVVQTSTSTQSQSMKETYIPADITLGMKNALNAAKRYLNLTSFSYEGLVNQLEYEEYSHEEAIYAANNCGANWSEQALKKSKSYLKLTSFSYQGLIDQLEYEGFTSEQAIFGASNCGADWYEQAAQKAASYLSLTSFSRSRLIQQLEFEGFTHDQAVYGVSKNGY